MITLNSTILSYNKIREIDEYKPMLPPDSIYIPGESNNLSFQKFIPDIYDLDKIEFNDLNIRRTLTPKTRNQTQLKKYFGNSVILNEKEKKNKYIESSPNVYSNEKEKSIHIKNFNEIDFRKEEIQNTNIYKNEKNKINYNIINNLNLKKNIYKNNNKNKTGKIHKKEIILDDVSDPKLNIDVVTSQKKSLNKNKLKILDKKIVFDKKSIHSAQITFNYKNIMRKDPTRENTYIFNTSFYKKKHKNGNKPSNNQSEINRNSFNSILKLEESVKEHNLRPSINKKEEILKSFINSNNNLNNSKSDKSNLNSLVNDFSNINNNNNINMELSNNDTNLNIDEMENESVSNYEDKKDIKCKNLTNYTFRTGKSNNNNIINQPKLSNPIINKNTLFNTEEQKLKNRNINYNTSPIFNTITKINNNNNNDNINIISKKPTIGSISSLKKYNFDYPKKIKDNDYSKDEENKSKSFISNFNINENNVSNEKPKIINNNSNQIVHIKFNNIKKIMYKNGFFNILTFLDCYDLMCLLKTNKSFIFLINKTISNAYYNKIKQNLNKFKNDFELLKCSLIYSKVKDALKIDFVINIRFINKKNNIINTFQDKNEFFKRDNEKEITPKCFQIIYFYNYFKSMNPIQKLKTKENTKKIKMYDYYTYDLYSEYDKTPNIYINKEQLLFKNNNNSNNNIDKLLFIQPILPFKINDKGIINLEIYSSNNDFINPSSIKIILKSFDLKKYLVDLDLKGYNNLRICEYENICFHWKLINNENSKNKFKDIIKKIENNFRNYFYIQDISYESIGFFVFKINLIAIHPGKIDNSKNDDDFGINIIIRNKREVVENEIKKNNLLLERREIYEMRVGETITLYFSTKIKK